MEQMGMGVSKNTDNYLGLPRDPAYKQLTACYKKHTEAIEFAELMETHYTWLFSLVVLNMITMSITGYQAVVRLDVSLEDASRYGAFTMIQMLHLFFHCFFSQNLMNHSERIRDYIYQAEWYKTSVRVQKLLTMVTMRSNKPCQLTGGKFLVSSLDGFTSMVKTSMSYFTLIRSMR